MPEDTPYNIHPQWKEELIYSEGTNSCTFQCGWGVSPPVAYIPDEATWRTCLPPWMHDHRAIIVERLRAGSGHTLEEAPMKPSQF